MSRRAMPFAQLARLQGLAVLERRRELEEACAETDRSEAAATALAEDLRRAEQGYAEIHADQRMCLSRLTVAAAIVNAGDAALDRGRAALDGARSTEGEAGSAWLLAQHRADWFAERDRDQRRADGKRRDDRAETEARGLRLALAQGAQR